MKRLGLLVLATTWIAACSDDGSSAEGTGALLTVSFDNLPALGEGYVYENWLITPDDVVAAGRFGVDSDGQLTESAFSIDASVVSSATTYVLTIEPEVGDDPAPSDTHLLGGDIANGASTLTIDHPTALGDDFTGATGEYILGAPTGGPEAPYENGIWFLIPGEPPTAGFSLPTLPAGWEYEGWIVDADGPISLGRFLDPSAPDSDGPGPAAGPEPAPPFPGQDFLMPEDQVRDLSSGHMAVLSIEPEPDDSPAPFILKPLVHAIEAIAAPTTQMMDNDATATTPTGTAVLTP